MWRQQYNRNGVHKSDRKNRQSESPGSAFRERGSQMGKGRSRCPKGFS